MTDVISAISTAAGTGGVAIIRLSGEGSLEIAAKMFTPSAKIKAEDFIPNMMYTGVTQGDGFCDYGMCVYFKAPKSFTGEDVVEFHCHGGVQIARGILAKTLSLGARAAEKGEFTKRAFLNGKLSLSSAEGMIDMINAESLAALRAGSMLYSEKLTAEIKELQSGLQDVLAEIAADIDYPEEDLDGLNESAIKSKIEAVSQKLERLAASYSCGKKIKDGVTVAICGKPNTGKSSLLNALLGYDKAIVSDEAGTTRDAVEGELKIDGVKYNLVDTAGIRDRAGNVESIGIERARKIFRTADIILSVSDGGGEAEIENAGGKVIKVFNKCDLIKPCGDYDIAVSAKTGQGLEELKKLLSENSVGELSLDKAYIIEQRHHAALVCARESLESAMQNCGSFTVDVLAIDLKDAWDALGEITGETANEQIINTVFEKFCVGK
ncbi:MAG: tRNA uridine-5-carboxymethylaminomethyl(34) synthesis GTPase MnmE [Clostridia bacterium]|nr:tRNA uridine-5-carboxymethylaminomethyl(34) synthesis GTPase MnmE [Clostridia bacterium]